MKTEIEHPCPSTASSNRRLRSAFGIRHSSFSSPLAPRPSPLGFTFIEVLFAIIILGVGMIMIAGMLPVAIKQNADTRNDLTAKVVAEGGYAYLKTLVQTHPEAFPETCGQRNQSAGEPFQPVNNSNLDRFMGDEAMGLNNDDYTPAGASPKLTAAPAGQPPRYKAGRVLPLTYDVATKDGAITIDQMTPSQITAYPLAWHQSILADRVQTADPRFQWMAFYRRDESSSVVKLIIVAMRLQNADFVDRYRAYDEDTTRPPAQQRTTIDKEGIYLGGVGGGPNGPFLVPIEIEDSLTEPDKVKFTETGADTIDRNVAETGAYLIIAHSPPVNGGDDDASAPGDLKRPYRNNGRVFRLGGRRADLDSAAGNARVWDLQAGFDLPPAGVGADNIRGTLDDIADGSMNATISFDQSDRPTTPTNTQVSVNNVPIAGKAVRGTTAYAWLIGKGRHDPSTAAASPFVGPAQDLYVLSVDVPVE